VIVSLCFTSVDQNEVPKLETRPCLTNFCTHGPNALQADPFQPDSVIASGMATFMVKMIKKYENVNFRGTQFSVIPYPLLVDF
jgi:hypothetical protein